MIEEIKGEKRQRIHANGSWKMGICMLIYFLFAFVAGKLIFYQTSDGEHTDKLFVGHMKEELKCQRGHNMY